MLGEGESGEHPRRVKRNELPVDIWKYIFQLVATASLQSLLELRCVSKSFRKIADDWLIFALINIWMVLMVVLDILVVWRQIDKCVYLKIVAGRRGIQSLYSEQE